MTIVIAGASGGIGAATAEHVTREGATAVLVARRADALQQAAARCHGRAVTMVGDMTRRGEVHRVAQEVLTRLGRIDVWINNVGRGITRVPSELTDADLDEMIDVNVRSALYGMQETLPILKLQGRGQVINVSSMLGRNPTVLRRAAYSAAKHFLNALTDNFRTEVQETHPDIQYTLVSPGVVYTEFGTHALHGGPDSRQLPNGQPVEEVAEVIARVIVSRRPDVYTRPGSAAAIAAHYARLGEDA